MQPDGAMDKHKPPRRGSRQRPRPRMPRMPLRLRLVRLANAVRSRIGMRRLPEGRSWDYVPLTARKMEEDDDPEAFQRALPYMLWAMAFAAVAFLAFSAYGMLAPKPALVDRTGTRDLVVQALDHLRAGDADQALRVRNELRDQYGDDLTLHFLDGYFLAASGEDIGRLEKRAARSWPRRRAARDLLTLAGYREARKDMDGVVEALGRAVELLPDEAGIRLFRATSLLAAGRPREALEEADELEHRVGPNAVIHGIRGHAHLALGAPDRARRDFEAALLYNPSAPHIALGLVEALTRTGDYDRALLAVEDILTYDSTNAQALLALGIVSEKAGDADGSEQAYRRALEVAPDNVPVLNNLAYLLLSMKDNPQGALPHAKRARELAPRSGPVADTLGWTYFRLGRHQEALPLLREAYQALPDHPEVNWHMAEALLASGEREDGVTLLRELAALGDEAAPFADRARNRLAGLQ